MNWWSYLYFRGDSLRVGFCTPIGAELEFQSFHPNSRLSVKSRFTVVNSLAELDKDDEFNSQKYYLDETTG